MPASLARPVGSQFLYLPLCPQRKFGLASTPLRLFISPVGVPSGTAEAGDSTNRDKFGKTSQPRTPPGSHYDGRRHPPTDRTAAGKPRSQIARPSAAPRGGRNFVAAPSATGPSPKKNLAPRSLAARLGDSFYFAKCEIVESLLRRGARGLRGLPCAGGVRVTPAGRAKLRFAGACRLQPALSARWRKWAKTTHIVWPISYSSTRAVPLGTRTGLCLP